MEYQNKAEITALLEKFWNAETTESEELQIRNFFRYGSVPPEFEAFRHYFEAMDGMPVSGGKGLEFAIMAKINQGKKPGKFPVKLFRNLSIAASFALLFATGFYYIWKPEPVILQVQNISENEEIVQAAFQQTQQALFMLSDNITKGEQQMIHLTKFNQAQQRINTEKP